MNSPANSLISSLFNAAGVLIEARAETIWDVLDALMGEEGLGYKLAWRTCWAEGPVGSTLGRKGVSLLFTFLGAQTSHFTNQPSSAGQGWRDCFLFPHGAVSDLLQAKRKAETQWELPPSSHAGVLWNLLWCLSWVWSDSEALSHCVPCLSADHPLSCLQSCLSTGSLLLRS